jgi:hypothetical protein
LPTRLETSVAFRGLAHGRATAWSTTILSISAHNLAARFGSVDWVAVASSIFASSRRLQYSKKFEFAALFGMNAPQVNSGVKKFEADSLSANHPVGPS